MIIANIVIVAGLFTGFVWVAQRTDSVFFFALAYMGFFVISVTLSVKTLIAISND